MSELQERMDRLGWCRREFPGEKYDRRLFEVVEELVREVERLNSDLERERSERKQADSTLDYFIASA